MKASTSLRSSGRVYMGAEDTEQESLSFLYYSSTLSKLEEAGATAVLQLGSQLVFQAAVVLLQYSIEGPSFQNRPYQNS